MPDLWIYGASDDLVEVEGAIEDEFDVHGLWRARLLSPDGQSLIVTAQFGKPGAASDWTVGVENHTQPFPDWPIKFEERADYSGDPCLYVQVPEETKIIPYTEEEY